MQLSQSIKLRQKQSLVMTPQLQQAIKLLQMSNLELTQHLQEQMYDNPFLEVTASDQQEVQSEAPASSDKASEPAQTEGQQLLEQTQGSDISTLKESAALADDPTQHSDLDNRFDSSIADMPRSETASRGSGSDDFDILDNISQKEGFYPFLFRQLNLTFTKPSERMIATHFINALEPSGWIGRTVIDVADECGCYEAEAEDVLLQLQQFEPAGLFARNLAECLRLQLIDKETFTPLFGALLDNLDQLGRGEIRQLARRLKCDHDDILDMLAEIRTLIQSPVSIWVLNIAKCQALMSL